VEAPYNISNHRIFSTETYTEKFVQNSTTLEVLVPRFSQGDGSLVKINTLANSKPNLTSVDYVIYSTYDDGSNKLSAHVSKTPLAVPQTIGDQTNDFLAKYQYSTIGIIAGTIGLVVLKVVTSWK
jgi:hypothetical protein